MPHHFLLLSIFPFLSILYLEQQIASRFLVLVEATPKSQPISHSCLHRKHASDMATLGNVSDLIKCLLLSLYRSKDSAYEYGKQGDSSWLLCSKHP